MGTVIWPWLESLGVVLLAGLGAAAGLCFARCKKKYWLIGYFVPLGFAVAIALARWLPALAFVPPFSWIMAGRIEFAVIALAATMMLTTLIPRLRRKRQRTMVAVITVFFAMYFVLPFLLPALMRGYLARLETKVDADGVCRQATGFSCGPAAAVTALRKLGLPAEEGELAIIAHTTPIAGTQADSLSLALSRHYAQQGLLCEYRHFKSIAELRAAGLVITVIKFSLLVDHYVTVLQVSDDKVIVGDSLAGLRTLSYDEFNGIWRNCGIVLKLPETAPPTDHCPQPGSPATNRGD